MRNALQLVMAVSAVLWGLTCSRPAAAADAAGYAIAGASQSRGKYPYLTMESVMAKLQPRIAAQVPPAESARLVLLNVVFRATGGPGELRELDPADLQVQWTAADGARGAAPVLGTHLSKDSINMVGGRGFFITMRSDSYELFAIVPQAVRTVDLAKRQEDGSFKLVRSNIRLSQR